MKRALCGVLSLLLLCSASAVSGGDKEDVAAAMAMWKETLAQGTSEEPGAILDLYAEDAVLWGTISTTLRDTPDAIRDYFVNAYAALPELTVEFREPRIRIYGDTAINSGYYTFTFMRDGESTSLPARYSFTYVKRNGEWLIVDHHSSGMPE